jgi:hypothetical protein
MSNPSALRVPFALCTWHGAQHPTERTAASLAQQWPSLRADTRPELTCVECRQPLRFRCGSQRVPHFAHIPQASPDCGIHGWSREGIAHRHAKVGLAERIRDAQDGRLVVCRGHDVVVSMLLQELTAATEVSLLPDARGFADVAVFSASAVGSGLRAESAGSMALVIEIYATHRTESYRPEPWCECDADAVLEALAQPPGDLVLNCTRRVHRQPQAAGEVAGTMDIAAEAERGRRQKDLAGLYALLARPHNPRDTHLLRTAAMDARRAWIAAAGLVVRMHRNFARRVRKWAKACRRGHSWAMRLVVGMSQPDFYQRCYAAYAHRMMFISADVPHDIAVAAYDLWERTFCRETAVRLTRQSRIYLWVPYSLREEAKACGARWDTVRKRWYLDAAARTTWATVAWLRALQCWWRAPHLAAMNVRLFGELRTIVDQRAAAQGTQRR